MSDNKEAPLGVKMLADHLVSVKLQYEEQINTMLVRIRNMEKEKKEMQQQYQELYDELELRRRELFILKREDSIQYMLEERENWEAMLVQQRKANAKLEKDLEISRERIQALQQQLENVLNTSSPVLDDQIEQSTSNEPEESLEPISEEFKESTEVSNEVNEDSAGDNEITQEVSQEINEIPENTSIPHETTTSSEETINETTNPINSQSSPQSLMMGPPQPTTSPVVVEELSDAYTLAISKQSRMEKEMEQLRREAAIARKEAEETRRENIQLTNQFTHRIDEMERDHQEQENALLSAIDSLKLKLDLELEKKWELIQELREQEANRQEKGGLMSFLWG